MINLSLYEGQGQVGALFGNHLLDIVEEHPELRVISADMSYIAQLERFKATYPDQFINMGIAEQNMIGVSAGLTEEGFKCVCLAQACFITMRCFEQVRQYMSYMQSPIILIGLAAGFSLQFMGNTHYAMEDIALMRSIPNIIILSPADAGEAVKAFDYALSCNKPVYIRFTGSAAAPLLYKADFQYDINKAIVLQKGDDIAIFATGSMVSSALDASKIIAEHIGLAVRVVDVHCLKPLDIETIKNACTCKLIVSLEEHYKEEGLGSSIADVMVGNNMHLPLLKLGINGYSDVGDYRYLLEQHRLKPAQIAEDIMNKIQEIA